MKIHGVISEKFKIFSRQRGMNQTQVASEIGMDQSELSKRISGKLNLNVVDLEKIAKVLEIEPYELLKPDE